eukprot:scaffold4768_cov412-Prasinococcus_capsulatus_cf.AAC.20
MKGVFREKAARSSSGNVAASCGLLALVAQVGRPWHTVICYGHAYGHVLLGFAEIGKSTVAYTLEHALYEEGKLAMVLDGDNIRHGLCKNLSFSAEDREENIRRIGEVSKLFADTGIITLVSFISPYRRDRDAVRALMPEKRERRDSPAHCTGWSQDFIEIYMKIPLEVCEQRDPKGLYKAARAGKIKGFTGIDDPYEHPENPELEITVSEADGVMQPPAAMAKEILEYLRAGGYLVGA